MALTSSSQDRRREKVKNVFATGRDNKWGSLNEFLFAFFSSEDKNISRQANTCLRYKHGQIYAPEKLLTIWLERTHGESRQYLQETITRNAADIMVKESDRAIRDERLRVSATGATIPRLSTPDFGLGRLAEVYQTLLPCMWMLLLALLTASNTYERKNHTTKLN